MMKQVLCDLQAGRDPMQLLYTQRDYAYLDALSPIHRNLLDWYSFRQDADVLELNSGCGVLTGLLCERCRHVIAVESDTTKREIAAILNRDVSNRKQLETIRELDSASRFDYIVLYGLTGDSATGDLLSDLQPFLKKDGVLIIAADNRFAVRYAGVNKKSDEILLSRQKLISMLKAMGYSSPSVYYPYPDYRFPLQIFSEERLPGEDEIFATPSFDRPSYRFVSEKSILMDHVQDGTFAEAANSWLIFCGDDPSLLYAKYNSTRNPAFAVATMIEKKDGVRTVRKHPETSPAESQIGGMKNNRELLLSSTTGYEPISFRSDGKDLVFPFIEGAPLLEHPESFTDLDEMLSYIQEETAVLFADQKHMLSMCDAGNAEITSMFPNVTVPEGVPTVCPANLDSIASNFIRQGEKLICIDYEWVVDFPVPVDYLRFRCYHYLYEQYELLQAISEEAYLEKLGIDREDQDWLMQMERCFQQYVHGEDWKYIYTAHYEAEQWSMREIRAMQTTIDDLNALLHRQEELIRLRDQQLRHPIRTIIHKLVRK